MKAFVITIKDHARSEASANRCIKSGLKNGITIEKISAVTLKDKPKQMIKDNGYLIENYTEEFRKTENTTATFLYHNSF